MKKLTTLFSVLCLTLALTVPASALDYNIDGPGDPEYGKSTSIEPVATADRGELPNVDVSKNAALIPPSVGDTWMFLQYCYGFFLNADSLFFITNDGITEVGRTLQRTKLLDIPTNGNIAFDGRTIYYINEDSLLTAYDTKTHKTRPFRNMVAYDFCLTDQGLYFINRMDSDCVYLCGKDGVGSLKISNDPALSVNYDGEEVTMILKSDGKEVVFEP